jgi:alkanesulfonate monooxygenase SsuD/methylene tetrahydromethanopterin reductase-like flavin-dependent oxidoreductase (luciferase family)
MHFGVHFHSHGALADPRLLVELSREAEASGWDGVFVSDHLTARSAGEPAPVANPWVALAAIAAATERVRVGPMVTPLPRRRPWQLAGEAATLDHLSNGRLILGVGSGTGLAQSFSPFHEEPEARARADMLDEGLAVLMGLWSGQSFSFAGERYRVEEVVCLPRPVQSPRIPIWVAGHWPHRRPFRRAARWDGAFIDIEGVDWLRGDRIAPADLSAAVAYVQNERQADGPFDVVIGGQLPRDRAEAAATIDEYAAAGLTWWVEGIHEAFAPLDELRARIRRGPPPP